jgi:hypothetical protein
VVTDTTGSLPLSKGVVLQPNSTEGSGNGTETASAPSAGTTGGVPTATFIIAAVAGAVVLLAVLLVVMTQCRNKHDEDGSDGTDNVQLAQYMSTASTDSSMSAVPRLAPPEAYLVRAYHMASHGCLVPVSVPEYQVQWLRQAIGILIEFIMLCQEPCMLSSTHSRPVAELRDTCHPAPEPWPGLIASTAASSCTRASPCGPSCPSARQTRHHYTFLPSSTLSPTSGSPQASSHAAHHLPSKHPSLPPPSRHAASLQRAWTLAAPRHLSRHPEDFGPNTEGAATVTIAADGMPFLRAHTLLPAALQPSLHVLPPTPAGPSPARAASQGLTSAGGNTSSDGSQGSQFMPQPGSGDATRPVAMI